jgi:hypothetical protein
MIYDCDIKHYLGSGETPLSKPVLSTLLRPLLPYLAAPARVFTTRSACVYAPPRRKVTAVTIFLPWNLERDPLLFSGIAFFMHTQKKVKVARIGYGSCEVVSVEDVLGVRGGDGDEQAQGKDEKDGKEKEGEDGDVGLMYNGEKCRVGMIWGEWSGDKGKTFLKEVIKSKQIPAAGLEEKDWRFEKVEDMVKEPGGISCCIM